MHEYIEYRRFPWHASCYSVLYFLLPTFPAKSDRELALNIWIKIVYLPINKVVHKIDQHFASAFEQ